MFETCMLLSFLPFPQAQIKAYVDYFGQFTSEQFPEDIAEVLHSHIWNNFFFILKHSIEKQNELIQFISSMKEMLIMWRLEVLGVYNMLTQRLIYGLLTVDL